MAVGVVGSRRYFLYRPRGYKTGAPRPLIVMLHGCLQDAKALVQTSQMNRLADREGFFVLYPEQDRLSNPQGCWNWFATRTGQAMHEADAIIAVVDQICQSQNVNPNQVALAGFSAGASMAALVGSREPSLFRALALHSGVASGVAKSQATALQAMRGRGPLPGALATRNPDNQLPALLVIHGSADSVVAPRNGLDAAMQWAACQGATSGPSRRVQRGKRYATTVTDYKAAGRLVASHCLVNGLGHAWSGGASGSAYSDPKGPDASRMFWAFAKRQFTVAQRTAQASGTRKIPTA